MKLHKVEITLTASAFVRADKADDAVKLAQEIKGKIMVLDPEADLVFAGPLSSSKRPELSVSPTVVCVDVDTDAVLVHRS